MSMRSVMFAVVLSLAGVARAEGGTHTQGVSTCGAEFDENLFLISGGSPSKTIYLPVGDCYHANLKLPLASEVDVTLLNNENSPISTIGVVCDGSTGLSQFCYTKGSACGKKADARLVVLPGRVRAGGYDRSLSGVTLACALDENEKEGDPDLNNGAVGKCILPGWFGYSVDSALPQFQACLRMARADYCSCGISETQPKVMIQAYRPGTIPECKTPKLKKGCFEASWNERGPVCYSHKRATELRAMLESQQKTFKGLAQSARPDAGAPRVAGATDRFADVVSCLQTCLTPAKSHAVQALGWAPLECKPTEPLGSMLLLNRARHQYDKVDCERGEYDPDCQP